MAISAETEAILERLKAEGQLTRNSGANSIRSVKIQLDRFEGVFNTISGNIAEQTQMLRKSLNITEESIEAQKRAADFAEIQQNQVNDDDKPETSSETTSESKKSKGLFDMLAGFGGSLLGLLKPILIGGAGLFVAYNFAKGYIDGKTGGGFTKFENAMIDTFNSVDWSALGASFMTFASKVPEAITSIVNFLSDPLNAILAGAGLTAATILAGFGGGALARGVTRGIIDGVLGGGGRDGAKAPKGGKGLMNLKNVARAGALGILTGALAYYGDDVKEWLQTVGVPENWSNVAVDTLTAVGTGATLGMMFGPTGALVGAAAGLAYSLGKGIWNWFKESKEDAEKKLEKRLALANAAEGNLGALNTDYDDAILRAARIKRPNTDGAVGSASASGLMSQTDAEQLARAGNIYGEDFDVALENAAKPDATAEEILEVQKMLDEATIQHMKDRYQGILAQRGQLRMLGDNLGDIKDDPLYLEMEKQMDELKGFIELTNGEEQNFIDLYRMFRNEMMSSFTDRFSLDEYEDIKGDLTPEQRRIFEKLRGLMDPSNEIGAVSSVGSAQSMQQLADAAMGNGGQFVIGKIGGDTYQTIQNTKMGDTNYAEVKQIQTGTQSSHPFEVA